MKNPFKVGDSVVFMPDERAMGWHQHSFERWGIHPGLIGLVTAVNEDAIEIDGRAEGAMHWSQFKRANEVTASERDRLAAEYRRRMK